MKIERTFSVGDLITGVTMLGAASFWVINVQATRQVDRQEVLRQGSAIERLQEVDRKLTENQSLVTETLSQIKTWMVAREKYLDEVKQNLQRSIDQKQNKP